MNGGGAIVTSAESGATPIVAFLDGDGIDEIGGNPLWEILKADMAERNVRIEAAREGKTSTLKLQLKTPTLNPVKTTGDPFAANEAAWAELLAEEGTAKPARRAAAIGDASGLSDLRVPALIATKWDQGNGAGNYYTPPFAAGDSNNYPCGCVALAGAQIAYFWQFPTEPRPQVTRTCYISGVETNCTTLGGAYDWSNMPTLDFYSAQLPTAQRQAAGKLCYDFGVATRMNWGPNETGGSGTVATMLAEAFTDVFGYANAVAYTHSDGNVIPAALVEKAVLCNLDAGCPVVVSLAGHSVAADGYGYFSGTLYTHLNFGWSGLANAWYNLPEVDDSAGTGYTSSVLDQVVYNIFSAATGELLTGRVLDANGDPVSGATVVATRGTSTVTGTTDARGVYALRVAGGQSWTVVATDGADSGSTTAFVAASASAEFARTDWGSSVSDSGTIGNSWGNDITLGVDVPAEGIFFVDEATGADANDGRSWATAKASIQAAIDASSDGDSIFVADGRYEPISTANKAITIRSVNGPETTFIDGSLQWARGVTNRCATLGSETAHTNTVLSGFTLTNGCTPTNGVTAVVSGGGSCYGKLVGCTLTGNTAKNGGGSYGATLNSCIIWNNMATGSGGGASNGTLNNCTVANNTAVENGGGTYYATINNCIVWNNTAASRPAHYGATCRYSCLDDALSAADDKGNNIIASDPGFVDALHGDFHLLADSPCINAGTNDLAVGETDFYGDTRIVGGTVDMGASEYQTAAPTTGYAAWAAGNGLGAADAVTDGQPNLIRYVFGRPSGAFSPIAGITFQDGNPVLLFPSFNPDVSGVSLSILSTTNLLDWAHAEVLGPITPPFNFGGLILTHGYEAPSRFYRLKAEEQ